jgi:hypothetical protein
MKRETELVPKKACLLITLVGGKTRSIGDFCKQRQIRTIYLSRSMCGFLFFFQIQRYVFIYKLFRFLKILELNFLEEVSLAGENFCSHTKTLFLDVSVRGYFYDFAFVFSGHDISRFWRAASLASRVRGTRIGKWQ